VVRERSTRPPSQASRAASRGEPVSAARFAVLIAGVELDIARVSAPSLAAHRPSLRLHEIPAKGRPSSYRWSGGAETGSLVLSRALDGDRTLSDWRRSTLSTDPAVRAAATRNVQVRLLGADGNQVVSELRLHDAWPLRWTGPELDGLSVDVAWEHLEVVYTDLTVV
jgi:phage tail-like protein